MTNFHSDDDRGTARADRPPVSPERIATRVECEKMFTDGIAAINKAYTPGTGYDDPALSKMIDKAEQDVNVTWSAMARGERTAADFRKAFTIYYKLQRVAISKCVAKGAAA